ncbi:hypothetical protein BDP27DRAFT_1442064 [Rhodocollybia butyracea]|uniref:F-box domain-containing protein n=1 Tax=Rhodocollybia butyracea TaxID=206335 RepID=A0A9P5UEL8_9AGAR|nr:hypothetical protein BDP27DRAFT_1442064 [Rhodocollybia butyracea]
MLCEKCNTSIPDTPLSASFSSSSSLQNLLRAQNSLALFCTSEIRDIIAGLDVDADRIRWELISLTNKLKRLEIQQEKYKSLLAPIRRLPSEVLNLIFTHFSCDPDMQNNISESFGITLPGCSLMAVCSRWRNIVLSCTALWRKIQLNTFLCDDTEEAVDDLARLAAPVKWCLDHAGGTGPLDISFQGNMVQFPSRSSCVFYSLSFPSFAALKNCALKSLKSLEFYIDQDQGRTEFDIFCNAPQLTRLTLFTLPTVERKETFPWGQIKTLELSFIDPNYELFRALAFCPSLETLSYVFSYIYDESRFSEIPPQTSETIRSLSVVFEDGHCAPQTFSSLMDAAHFPALQEMSIYYEELQVLARDTLWSHDKFISLLLRSGCSLTTLEMENIVICNDDLVSLLVTTPELCRFNFYEKTYGENEKEGICI